MITTTDTRTVVGLDNTGKGVVFEQQLPELTAGTVLVRITATMISPGTQLSGVAAIRRGDTPGPVKPKPLGYQAAGEVIAVGANVHRLAIGQRVACFGPAALHTNLAVVPQNLCAPIPDGVTDEEASGMNLVLTAVQALRRTPAQLGESLLVVGLGIVGQLTCQFGSASGLYTMGWDLSPGRRELAGRFAADATADPRDDDILQQCDDFTEGMGFDAAVLAIGGDGSAALNQVKSVMKVTPDGHAMGQVTLVGGLETTSRWGAGMGNLDLHSSARSGPGYHDPRWELGEVEYPSVFVRWTTQTNMRMALRMMADRKIRIQPMITHELPLTQIDHAIDLLLNQPNETMAVILKPDLD